MPRMLSLLSALAVCLLPTALLAQTPSAPPAPAPGAPAQPAGAPMSAPMYLIVYKLGPAWKTDVPDSVQLRDHGRYMFGLHTKKVLKWAGPFTEGGGGAAVVDAESLAAAKAIAEADPAVSTKVFTADVHEWRHVNWDELAKRFQQMQPAATKPPSER